MRLALPILVLVALVGAAAFWFLRSDGPAYRTGAERMYSDVSRVRDDLRLADVTILDRDLRHAQLAIIEWRKELPPADAKRASVTELDQALAFFGSSYGAEIVALEPGMESQCADLLDTSAKEKISGDEHLAKARRQLDAGR